MSEAEIELKGHPRLGVYRTEKESPLRMVWTVVEVEDRVKEKEVKAKGWKMEDKENWEGSGYLGRN